MEFQKYIKVLFYNGIFKGCISVEKVNSYIGICRPRIIALATEQMSLMWTESRRV